MVRILTERHTALLEQISRRDAIVGVIGLGYVGLPVACLFAEAGFPVRGIDLDADRVARIRTGRSPIEGVEPGLSDSLAAAHAAGRLDASTDYGALADADIVTISVETPVDDDHVPRYEALTAACRSLGSVLRRGTLVIVESTIAPGTIDGLVRPALERATGMVAGSEFFLGHCPERVMPGRLLANLRTMSRVCGGDTPETAGVMAAFYRHVVGGDLDEADCVTAEIVKTAENAYRDVNIAFANEVALICEAVGGDVWRVRELVNKSPGRLMLLPGAGVGGHCIPKDPWLLIAGYANDSPARLVPAARAVNDGMPLHVAGLVELALARQSRHLDGARVCVLGFAYLENSDDTRNTPSEPLVRRLRERGVTVVVHDPYVSEYRGAIEAVVEGADAVVVMVQHDEYRSLDLAKLRAGMRTPVLVDARAAVDPRAAESAGLVYSRLGSGI